MLSNSPLTSSPRSVVPQPAWSPCRVFQLTTILIAPVFFGLAPAPVNAASQITCNNSPQMSVLPELRASETQLAVRKSEQLKCGFSGARWHPDAEGHFRWCMGLNLGPSRPDSPT